MNDEDLKIVRRISQPESNKYVDGWPQQIDSIVCIYTLLESDFRIEDVSSSCTYGNSMLLLCLLS